MEKKRRTKVKTCSEGFMKHQRSLRSMSEWKMCCGDVVWCRKQAKYNQTQGEAHMLMIAVWKTELWCCSMLFLPSFITVSTCHLLSHLILHLLYFHKYLQRRTPFIIRFICKFKGLVLFVHALFFVTLLPARTNQNVCCKKKAIYCRDGATYCMYSGYFLGVKMRMSQQLLCKFTLRSHGTELKVQLTQITVKG